MGYRSQVGAVISVDAWTSEPETDDDRDRMLLKYKEMIGFIKLSKFYEVLQKEDDRDSIGWRGGEFFFYVQDWKWYPDYEIVKAWDELWSLMQDIEGISGYFCRVGEESNDIEQENFGEEPDYEAFQPYTGLNCDVLPEVFGKGDIDAEIKEEEESKKAQPDCAGANHATETQ
jgi:hypothetical protein